MACGRLFRNTTAGGARGKVSGQTGQDVVLRAVKDGLQHIGVAPDNHSPVGMRQGGRTLAVVAGTRHSQAGCSRDTGTVFSNIIKRQDGSVNFG